MSDGQVIALEDVRDVRGFAISQALKSPVVAKGLKTDAEREEAIDEAVALIFELHGLWDPKRCAKFSAYLMTYLPKRLVSWYRVELRQSGRGRWSGSTGEYRYNGMVSIDAMVSADHRPGDDTQEDSISDSALITYGAEDEADGEALDELLAAVSGAPA